MSNDELIDKTTNFNPAPLTTPLWLLSTVNTSPTWYPVPADCIETLVTTPFDTVAVTVQSEPLPVRAIVLTVPLILYPEPPVIISSPLIGPPCPSIIPVTLWSSASPAAPVLTFLPIGKLVLVLVPPPSIVTFNFLGSVRIGFNGNTWVFKLPASIGEL